MTTNTTLSPKRCFAKLHTAYSITYYIHGQHEQSLPITYNVHITVMPHPPRLVVGEDFEGGLTSAASPLEGAFIYCTFTHVLY